jgi:hypothetical protein
MFLLTTLAYPLALLVACVGAGLLVKHASGGWLAVALLPVAGAAALIALAQLMTYVPALAPLTPYAMVALALAGYALAWSRAPDAARDVASIWRAADCGWPLATGVLVYALALAPVLASGRPTFSSFMALSDSAVHMLGADYLLRHGQSYAHLDLRNSYGQFVNAYYNSNYPSGADTLLGSSARLLGLPLIWAFQPFVAFMLATAAGPAWLLVQRLGLQRMWAALATLSVTLPALVYAYDLIGSVKEIAVLAMILALGVLVTAQTRWLRGPPAAAIPFALLTAAGVSTLGVGFGVWALAAALVGLGVLFGPGPDGTSPAHRAAVLARMTLVGTTVVVVAAWPTWIHIAGSVQVTQNIAGTSNPGNLQSPLQAVQAFGVWLHGSYKLSPSGAAHGVTYALIVLVAIACLLGVVWLARTRRFAYLAWIGAMLAVWLVVSAYSTTWVSAKTLMLTSPIVVLGAWAGVASLRATRLAPLAGVVVCVLLGGALVSDALQYHSSDLAPTARYDELASIDARFAGRGPTLFTDFDEYSLYELRDMDVGGPDFAYPPPALAEIAGGYGHPVDLERALAPALEEYPLIVTRRDPSASRPPAVYRLAWQGAYYQVWMRRSGAPRAVTHLALSGDAGAQCAAIGQLARLAVARGARLVAAREPPVVRIAPARASHPRHWGRERAGVVMRTPGALTAGFSLAHGGVWQVWLQGRLMPSVRVSVDGRTIGSIAGQLAGNSLVPDTMTPLAVHLAAGRHRVAIVRGDVTLAPGDGGTAVLDSILLAPDGARPTLRSVARRRWRSLCGSRYQWVELVALSVGAGAARR